MPVTIAAATFAASRLLKKLVGPQPQEAELAAEDVGGDPGPCTQVCHLTILHASAASYWTHAWLVCSLMSGSCPTHVHCQL